MLDCKVEQLNAPDAKRHYTTFYKRSIKLQKTLLKDNEIQLHNGMFYQSCFNGKKIFDRVRLAVLTHFCAGNFFTVLKTFRKEINIIGENCFLALKEITDLIYCNMS